MGRATFIPYCELLGSKSGGLCDTGALDQDHDSRHVFFDRIITLMGGGDDSSSATSWEEYWRACDILCHFHMEDCKPAPSPFHSGVKLSVTCTSPEVDATLYHQLVGKLLYLTHIRPDLSFAIGLVAWFMQNPRESHWKAAKRILRYV